MRPEDEVRDQRRTRRRQRRRRRLRWGVAMSDETATDFAVVVYREDDGWAADALPSTVGDDLDELVEATRRQSGGGGAIGLVSVEDDFFVAVRVLGRDVKLLLSDVTAAGESPLAGE